MSNTLETSKKSTAAEEAIKLKKIREAAATLDPKDSARVLDLLADYHKVVASGVASDKDTRPTIKILSELQAKTLEHEARMDLGEKVYLSDPIRVASYKLTLAQSHAVLIMTRLIG